MGHGSGVIVHKQLNYLLGLLFINNYIFSALDRPGLVSFEVSCLSNCRQCSRILFLKKKKKKYELKHWIKKHIPEKVKQT